jgi:hypothetical protein
MSFTGGIRSGAVQQFIDTMTYSAPGSFDSGQNQMMQLWMGE